MNLKRLGVNPKWSVSNSYLGDQQIYWIYVFNGSDKMLVLITMEFIKFSCMTGIDTYVATNRIN